jgi:hypothetical protein
MYNPPTYLTRDVLVMILDEFIWPSTYTISEQDNSVDGIKVYFEKCNLFFREGFESEISLFISKGGVNKNKYWTSFELINYVYAPKIENAVAFKKPILNNHFSSYASLEKVKYGLRDNCILLQTYLMPCLNGDFHLIEEYNKGHPDNQL